MAEKSFGAKKISLIGASGTPTIASPNNLNIDAVNVAISTNISIGGEVTSDLKVATGQSVGIGSTQPTATLDVIGTVNVSGISTFESDVNIGTGGTTAFFDVGSGNIGIGSTQPTATLDVIGTVNVSGISTLGVVEINAGIITNTSAGVPVTVYGDLIGTASTASFATTAFTLNGILPSNLNVAFAQTAGIATNVIGGIASVTSLSVSGISTLGVVEISSGIITATAGYAVTVYGDLIGTASTASFATTAFTLNGILPSNLNVAFAQTAGIATNVIGGIASVTSLSVSGISTLGVVEINAGIITNTSAGVPVTVYGDLIGTASTASFATTAFTLNGILPSNLNVAFAQTAGIATNVIGGIASVTSLSVSGISTLGVVEISSGIITATAGYAVTVYGDLIGTASTASFATTAFTLNGILPSNLNVATATTATNIAGGNTGSVPYQSSAGITTFLAGPSIEDKILGYNTNTNEIIWTDVSSAGGVTNTAITVKDEDGASYNQNDINELRFYGDSIDVTTGGTGIASIRVTSSGIATYADNAGIATYADNAGIATNIAGGAAGSIPYQSAPDTTAFLSNGNVGQILSSKGGSNAPEWVNAASSGISGITIREEGFVVGSAGSIGQINFVGDVITATASGNISTITVNASSGVSIANTDVNSLHYIGISSIASGTLETLGVSSSSLIYNPSTQRLGINTDNLTSSLTIDGTFEVVNSLSVTPSGSGGNIFEILDSSEDTVVAVTTEGHVGIGTTIPTNAVATSNTSILNVGIVTANKLYGDGSNLEGVSGGIGIQSASTLIGTGFTTINFAGSQNTIVGNGNTITVIIDGVSQAGSAGTAFDVIGGIASVSQLSVSGVSTISGVEINAGIITAKSGIVTYYGDGSNLEGVTGDAEVNSQQLISTPVYPVLTNQIGVAVSLGIATTGSNPLVFIPSTGRLGVGTVDPQAKLHIVGTSTFDGDAMFINDNGIKFGGVGNTSITIQYNSTTNSLDFVVSS